MRSHIAHLGSLALLCACFDLPPPLELVGDGGGGEAVGGAGPGGSVGAGGAFEALPPCSSGVPAPCSEVESFSLAAHHSCAVFSDGAVRCWGSNEFGQLGHQAFGAHHAPAVHGGLYGFEQLTAGAAYHCALAGGQVFCEGANDLSQLGPRVEGSYGELTEVPAGFPVHHMALGVAAACVASTSSDVKCWGRTLNGQPYLGVDGVIETNAQPLEVLGLADTQVVELDVGLLHACALVEDRMEMRCWGDNDHGRLGNGEPGVDRRAATPVSDALAVPVHVMSLGLEHTCVLGGDPVRLQCWGLLLGLDTAIGEPIDVPLDGRVPVDLSGGFRHSCVLFDDGQVGCLGTSSHGALGPAGSVTSGEIVMVPEIDDAIVLATGHQHNCVIHADGGVSCWGINDFGQTDPTSTDDDPGVSPPRRLDFE